jgi:hypothetical protein
VAADIGTGEAEGDISNSALCGANVFTGEQVLEYVDPAILPRKFARLAVAIARWLNDATLNWEVTGSTGKAFGKEVLWELHYWNVWRRPSGDQKLRYEKAGEAGWVNNSTGARKDLFDDLCLGMADNEFTPRSAEMIAECGGWEWDGTQIIYHGTGHGDRTIAAGVMWLAMHDLRQMGVDTIEKRGQIAPLGSIAWFEEQDRIQARKKQRDDMVDFGVSRMRHAADLATAAYITRKGLW